MKRLRWLWRFSLLLTLPVTLFLSWWVAGTTAFYTTYRFHTSATYASEHLYTAGVETFHQLTDTMLRSLQLKRNPADIQLLISEKHLAQLDSNLPDSGFSYKRGYLIYPDGSLDRVQMRYRGDMPLHWMYTGKSYRVKTRKKKLYRGARHLNLILPKSGELLSNHIGYKLASMMGLPAPDSRLVSVSINNRPAGLRFLVNRPDETFLRNRNRMPGDMYKGDNLGAGRYYGCEPFLYTGAYLWEKAAVNNHYPPGSRQPLKLFLDRLAKDDTGMADPAAFARFAAFATLANSTHYDNFHNWLLYYDPYREKMEPVVWDPMGWWQPWQASLEKQGVDFSADLVTAAFWHTLYRDYRFLHLRQTALRDFFAEKRAAFLQMLDTEVAQAAKKVEAIGRFSPLIYRHAEHAEVLVSMDRFAIRVRRYLARLEKALYREDDAYRYAPLDHGIRLEVGGRAAAEATIIRLNRPVPHPLEVRIAWMSDGVRVVRDVSATVRQEKDGRLIIGTPLMASVSISSPENSHLQTNPLERCLYAPGVYDILIPGIAPEDIGSVHVQRLDPRKSTVGVQRAETITPNNFQGVQNVVRKAGRASVAVWRGTRRIEGVVTIEGDLVIEPGSRIEMAGGSGIEIEGRLTAVGTHERPILFTAVDPSRPWGAVVLRNEKANGSLLEHCVFEHGSGRKGDLFEYTAMLTIHGASGVRIHDTAFRNGRLTDDMVHVVYGEASFRGCTFTNGAADALDADISRVVIEDCRFRENGNDAVDLMTSRAFIRNTILSGSGDKGVSVGENSRLLLIDSRLAGNAIGIHSKDASRAIVWNTVFDGNGKGVDAGMKNWRYGAGGRVEVYKSVLRHNRTVASADKRSSILLYDSYVDPPVKAPKRVTVDRCDTRSTVRSATPTSPATRFDDSFLDPLLLYRDDDQRGRTGG